ncbi:MAG: hypothetical protein JO187_11605, partial [Acidobacteria bacterium]|nr:hypothetical protein [Acidobacteriota bacterium]
AAAPRVRPEAPGEGDGDPSGAQKGTRAVYIDDTVRLIETPIYDRSRLESGDHIDGPCVIEELTATAFLPTHWHAIVDSFGNLVLRPTAGIGRHA